MGSQSHQKTRYSSKIQRPWKGPYVITEKLNDILYKMQESPRGNPKIVNYDRLKLYQDENKPTWFEL